MSLNLNLAKKFAVENVVRLALNYIEKAPVENFEKILDLMEKIAITEDHCNQIAAIRKLYEENARVIKGYLEKFDQIAESYRQGLLVNFFVNSGLLGIPYQQRKAAELGTGVPWAILIDPTSACNLNCTGCWAGKYKKSNSLDFNTIDRIINEAKELGIYFIVLSGGEPTIYPYLFDLLKKHQDAGFLMFTNGTLIDEKMADQMLEAGNITLAISLEGFREATDQRRGSGVFERLMKTMDLLKERGIVFGASITVTRNNVEELFGKDDFIDMLIEKGAVYTWSFHYIPVGKDPDLSLMVTPEQRKMLAERVPQLRAEKPLFLVDFWNDGIYSGGCIAGGRRYFHINARGDVEPCAFVHFAVDNIKEKGLKEVLKNPLFRAYQKHQPFNENLLLPCPIIDNNDALRKIVREAGAYPTHPGAEEVISEMISRELNNRSARWAQLSRPIFEERMGLNKANQV
jgi:MoaA/NifB/PqqE/SkfB family radical SAM enzyme